MPLSPAPVLPGTSPLTPPGQQPPNRRAQRAAVMISGVALVVLLGLGQVLLPRLVFLAPGLQAQAQVSMPGEGGTTFQGFQFPWKRTDSGGGYDNTASLQNMQSQASLFHMNAVIIPVVADVSDSIDSHISWSAGDGNNVHTLSDDQYQRAIDDALKAGLLPILELQLRALDQASLGEDSGSAVGNAWGGLHSNDNIGTLTGSGQANIGDLEKKFFDDYTAFAVHYAKISADHNLPYFIIGDGLTSVSYDMPTTSFKGDAAGHDRSPPGDPPCTQNIGRRDCSWRHVINAIKQPGYPNLAGGGIQNGARYKGKLMYAASWRGAAVGWSKGSEFDHITWWDAVDYIGVDANFPLTSNQGAPSVPALADAWHGKGDNLAGQNDIYARLEKVTDTYHRPIVFTSVEYDSAFGASSGQVQVAEQDNGEQLHDMQALLTTFSDTSWWAGVFWYADYPIGPRSKQVNWDVLGNWAGDTIDTSKDAGRFLATFYKPNPIKCDCTP